MSDQTVRRERFIRTMCRRAKVAYTSDLNPSSYAGAMRLHLRDTPDEATARLDCVIFAGLLAPGLQAAGAARSMRRAVSVREHLQGCGYWLIEPVPVAVLPDARSG